MISNIWNLTSSIVTELPTVTLATHNGNTETSALRDALFATVTVVQVGSYTRSPTTILVHCSSSLIPLPLSISSFSF